MKAIADATKAADILAAPYARYNTVKTAVLAISSEISTATADAMFDGLTTVEAIEAATESAVAKLRTDFLTQLPSLSVPSDPGYIDVTDVMVDNAGVHTNTNYWTTANVSETGGSVGVCNYGECEFYQRNFKFYQTLAMNVGTWEFGVTGFHRAGNHSTYFYAGEDKILIPGVESSIVNDMAGAKTYFDNGNGHDPQCTRVLRLQVNPDTGEVTGGGDMLNPGGDYFTYTRSVGQPMSRKLQTKHTRTSPVRNAMT